MRPSSMKKIVRHQEGSDFEIEVTNNQMEVRLANDFRKKVKQARRKRPIEGPKALLPVSFKISGTPGIPEPIEIKGEMFTAHNSWRIFFPLEDLPDQLRSDLPKKYSISYQYVPPKLGYLYWNTETGGIYAISPHLLKNPKTENYPFTVPLEVATPFLSGEKNRNDYYIGPSAKEKGKLELRKKSSDFSLVTDVSRVSHLFEILEGTLDPDVEVLWDKKEKILTVCLLAEFLPYQMCWLNFYITKRDDPYHLIHILKTQIMTFIQAKNRKIIKEIDTEEDISVYTNLVFDHYNLVRKHV